MVCGISVKCINIRGLVFGGFMRGGRFLNVVVYCGGGRSGGGGGYGGGGGSGMHMNGVGLGLFAL
ncbi:hypothetical protein Tco_0398904, partial [Tanacetum coccineum]